MEILYSLKKIKKFKKSVVALGVFDGVHLGHRFILRETVKKARQIKGTSVVVTFYPHPQSKLSLYSLAHRLKLIAELNVDVCIVIKFTPGFARISAEDFIKNILVEKIGAKFIYIGKNFRFGKSAQGDWRLLEKFARNFNYKLKTFNVVKSHGQPVSSTYIRNLITGGDLKLAGKLLMRPVCVLGTVVKGISLARRMGFPTANINPHHEILPPSGVYAVKIILNNKIYQGVCNIGFKPTVVFDRGEKEKNIEVHIFNFRKNIYRKDLQIEFIKKIRDERKYKSLARLILRIAQDVKLAQNILSSH